MHRLELSTIHALPSLLPSKSILMIRRSAQYLLCLRFLIRWRTFPLVFSFVLMPMSIVDGIYGGDNIFFLLCDDWIRIQLSFVRSRMIVLFLMEGFLMLLTSAMNSTERLLFRS